MYGIFQEQYIYNFCGLDCVNEAIIRTENENHPTVEAHSAECLGTTIAASIQTVGGESRPEHSCSVGQTEPSWPGPSACTAPWTRTRCWAGERCPSRCT